MKLASISPIGSVVIPAHNEAAVIQRCLDALLSGLTPGELDVVVVCNGCSDNTGDIVRSSWPSVRVIEVPQASKPAALRAADEVLSIFPRIYLDADVILPAVSARLMIESLRCGSAIAVRPRFSYDTSRSRPLVRSYYRARERVQSAKKSIWGGVYALSQAGRQRFAMYPDLVADDVFANQWFDPSEIEIVDSAPAIVTVPRRFRDLIRVARRRYKGNADIRSLPEGPRSTTASTIYSLLRTATRGLCEAADTLVFMAFATIVRISIAVSPPVGWSRDESSRTEITADGQDGDRQIIVHR
jgi:glycosyltransferase involved in cell wall biosynthesis